MLKMDIIHPWQEKIVGGFKPGEMTIVTSGRQTGKSQMQAYMRLWNDIHYRPVEDLKLTEGTVYGSQYYCVEPVGGSWFDMETWCIDSFGTPGTHMWDSGSVDPAQRWYMNNRKFWFRDDADRLMFVMRWR
jgi:hypothetical protein